MWVDEIKVWNLKIFFSILNIWDGKWGRENVSRELYGWESNEFLLETKQRSETFSKHNSFNQFVFHWEIKKISFLVL